MAAETSINTSIVKAFRAHGLDLPPQNVVSRSMNLRNHLLATGRFLTVLSASMLRFNAKA
jgi:hypothetical protein